MNMTSEGSNATETSKAGIPPVLRLREQNNNIVFMILNMILVVSVSTMRL